MPKLQYECTLLLDVIDATYKKNLTKESIILALRLFYTIHQQGSLCSAWLPWLAVGTSRRLHHTKHLLTFKFNYLQGEGIERGAK